MNCIQLVLIREFFPVPSKINYAGNDHNGQANAMIRGKNNQEEIIA